MVNGSKTYGIDPAGGHPERRLALSYAAAGSRDGLTALFALDAMLGHLVRTTRDPMVAQMRLAWWREALEALDKGAVPGQPILAALAHDVSPRGVSGETLAEMVDGWSLLLDPDGFGIEEHAEQRGARLFAAAGRVLDAAPDDPVASAGRGWAAADLAVNAIDPAVRASAREWAGPALAAATGHRWSAAGRAIGALAHVARMDLAARFPTGSPRRVARLLAHRLTGR